MLDVLPTPFYSQRKALETAYQKIASQLELDGVGTRWYLGLRPQPLRADI